MGFALSHARLCTIPSKFPPHPPCQTPGAILSKFSLILHSDLDLGWIFSHAGVHAQSCLGFPLYWALGTVLPVFYPILYFGLDPYQIPLRSGFWTPSGLGFPQFWLMSAIFSGFLPFRIMAEIQPRFSPVPDSSLDLVQVFLHSMF